jgi:hypothetical protein
MREREREREREEGSKEGRLVIRKVVKQNLLTSSINW